MPRAKVAKKQTASDVPATNGNDASTPSVAEGVSDVVDAIKQPAKGKARSKKTTAAPAAGEVSAAEEVEVIAKKAAVRGKKKAVEKVEDVVEVTVPTISKGRAKKTTTEANDVAENKTKTTKGRAKKEKITPVEEPEVVSKGRAKKEKSSLKEEAGDTVDAEPVKEEAPKSRGRKKKEPEQTDVAETAKPVPTKRRSKKDTPESEDRDAITTDAVAAKAATTKVTATKRARGTKRLADAEIAEVLAADEDPVPEPEPEVSTKKRGKQPAKQSNNENVEVPTKKRSKKAIVDEQQEEPIVQAPAPSRKRAQKKVVDNQDEEVSASENKPVRGRKRAAVDAEEDADAVAVDAADGSRTSKAKKPATQKTEAQAAGSFDKSLFTAPADKAFNLKISSWNVAGLRAWLKKDGLKFVDLEEPDIFCLQETKCANDQLPEEMARLPGYHPYWLCMPGGYAGVAIYSKTMPINVEYGIGNEEFDDVGRMITAEYEKFYLINVYVPNSGRKLVNLEMRMRWEKLFQAYVQKLDALKPVVICGDMNVSHLEIDLANPKSNTRNAGFTKEEREKMTELLALGYVDTFRHLYPKRTGAYSFWTYMSNARARNVGWRLDYCIVSERFVSRIVDNVMRSHCLGSDHCPITVFLNV